MIIGDIVNVLQNLDPAGNDYKRTMDNLNEYMQVNRFNKDLRAKLREYFMHSKELFHANTMMTTLTKLSPSLRGQVWRACARAKGAPG